MKNNLKNLDVDIPRNELVVPGQGSAVRGKSSLAFDTIYAEGQRRYMESLSSYARTVSWADGEAQCGEYRGIVSGDFY